MKKLDLFSIDFKGINLIEASAGTGKTWSIVHLYLKMLIVHQLKVQQILVVSYTKAATLELKARLHSRLEELLIAADDGFSEDENLSELICLCNKESILHLKLAKHNLDEASIFTIHGFCQNILSKFSLESAFFDQTLESDTSLFAKRQVVEIFRQDVDNFSQVQIEWIFQNKITPDKIFNCLFPLLNKLNIKVHPKLLESRILDIDLKVNQIIDLKNDILLKYQKFNLKDYFLENAVLNKKSYSDEYWNKLDDNIINYLNSNSILLNFSIDFYKIHSDVLNSKLKKNCALPNLDIFDSIDLFIDLYKQLENLLELNYEIYLADFLARLKKALDEDKKNNDWIGFDDLLLKVLDLLENNTSVANKILQDFPVAFIDEFQDTDNVQYQIFLKIYKNTNGILFLVGDPKQSIYAFRGANVFIYLKALQESDNKYYLDVNYRSNIHLMDKINHFFSIKDPFLVDIQYEKLKGVKNDFYVQNEHPFNLITYKTEIKNTESIYIDISRMVAYKILDLFSNKKILINDEEKDIQPNDIVILVSDHNQARIVQEQLSLLNIDSVCKTQESIMKSEEAYILYDILQAFLYPHNHYFTNWAKLSDFMQKEPSEILSEDNEKFIYYHYLWKQKGFLTFFYKWVLQENIILNLLRSENSERKITNIFHLMDILSIEDMKLNSMTGLVNWFSRELFDDVKNEEKLLRLESDKKRIQISTIHTSKGLEYSIVFCPFLWSSKGIQKKHLNIVNIDGELNLIGFLNNQDKISFLEKEQLAEKIRLLYVAITRSKALLYMYLPFGNAKIHEKFKLSALGYLMFSSSYSNLEEYMANFSFSDNPSFLFDFLNTSSFTSFPSFELKKDVEDYDLIKPEFFGNAQSAFEITSFSSLSHGAIEDLPDYDENTYNSFIYKQTLKPIKDKEDFYDFPKGAKAGLCLHALMELWANEEQVDIEENALFCLRKYNIEDKWKDILIDKFKDIINTNLVEFALKDITLKDRKTELEFIFPCKLDKKIISAIFKKYNFDDEMISAFNLLNFSKIQGFLKGFIDLIVFVNGKYYIIDYKTNYLGENQSFYSYHLIYQNIINEHYYLQYIIYSIALRRYLKIRVANFSNDLLGGVCYLFVRAMPLNGVFFTKLDENFLEELDFNLN